MKLIEFEGIDGSGKTTALKYVIEKLRERGYKVLETREVGNPNIKTCVELRKIVLDPESGMDGRAMELVFSAMRLMNSAFYEKNDANYDFAINDRGLFSHLAYTDNNVDEAFTNALYGGLVIPLTRLPDEVVYLKLDPTTALARRNARNGFVDAIEAKGPAFQEAVHASFAGWFQRAEEDTTNPIALNYIDANQDLDGVKAQLDTLVEKLITSLTPTTTTESEAAV